MWFYSTIALAGISLSLAIALCMALFQSAATSIEPRLLGTWVSDADKTVEMLPASTARELETLEKTRMQLGKMKISFSPTEIVTTLDGQIDRTNYCVLASDDYSCVIAESAAQQEIDEEMANIVKLSTFSVIHFEDQDSYWVQSQFGGFAEYFRRIPE